MARAKLILKLPVEEFCDLVSVLVSGEDYRRFTLGLQAGIRGVSKSEEPDAMFLSGYTFGLAMRIERNRTGEKRARDGAKGYAAMLASKSLSAGAAGQVPPAGGSAGATSSSIRQVPPAGATGRCRKGFEAESRQVPPAGAAGQVPPAGALKGSTEPPLEKMPFQGAAHSAFGTDQDLIPPGRGKNLPVREQEETAAPATGGPQVKTRKPRLACEDITPENAEFLKEVYNLVPKVHPITGEPVHKGSYTQAARAFQGIVSTGEATARELRAVGKLYYALEKFPAWRDRVIEAWDYRDRAMMHVATLYGPEKRPYRQLLPVARDLISKADKQTAASPMVQVPYTEAAS